MKKLIVPIIIGLVMFGAAFGGAFYFFRSEKAKEEAAIESIRATVLAALQKQGKAVVYTGRVVAVAAPAADAEPVTEADHPPEGAAEGHAPAPAGKAEAEHAPTPAHAPAGHAQPAESAPEAAQPHSTGGGFAIVPATVRYELDYKAIRKQDVVWDEEAKALKVTLPAITIAEPEIDGANIRQIGGSAPEAAIRKGALGALLEQAREEGILGQARETARSMVERAFTMPMQVEGVKAPKVIVRFADEPEDEEDEGGGGAGAGGSGHH